MRLSLALVVLLAGHVASAAKPAKVPFVDRTTPAHLFRPIYSKNGAALRAMVVNDTFPAGNMSALPRVWIPPDGEFRAQMAVRRGLYQRNKGDVFGVARGWGPRARRASQELLDDLVQTLTTDHPDHYVMKGRTIVELDEHGAPSGFELDLDDPRIHPLVKAGLLTQDDLTVTLPGKDGVPRMVAGFVATPTKWGVHDFLGQTIDQIHKNVGGYDGKLKVMVNGLLQKLPPERPRQRNNWFVLADQAFSQPSWDPTWLGTGPAAPARFTKNNVGDALVLRSEIETLFRLPTTGAMIFTIRPRTWTMDFVKHEAPDIARDLATGIAAQDSGYAQAAWARPLGRFLMAGQPKVAAAAGSPARRARARREAGTETASAAP